MDAQSAEPLAPIKKTYFALNERGVRKEFSLVRMLVNSCLENTSLQPCCVYSGPPTEETAWLVRRGVQLIEHQPRLEEDLKVGYGGKYKTYSGHWLRLDLPFIETESEYVLYTDIDVMFLRDPSAKLCRPRYLAVCPEHEQDNHTYFNTGVMVMNLQALRAVDPWFIASVKARLRHDFVYPTHDQRSFNDFFLDQVEWMPLELNWKPYWGVNEEAEIVHFHGPKPDDVPDLKAGIMADMKKSFFTIYNRNPKAYEYYAQRAAKYLA